MALSGWACARPSSDGSGPADVLEPSLPALPIETTTTGLKVFVVGIDGATRRVLDPLLADGKLPSFERLVEAGSITSLQSQKPTISPALWTTLATGFDRSEHGITQFTRKDKDTGRPVLANSRERRRLNVWDILGAGGRTVGVSGWWATWPAEVVNGWLVTDRLTRSRWSEWADGVKTTGVTYPARLAEDLLPHICDPFDPPLDAIRSLVPLTAEEEAELLAARKPLRGHGLSVLKFSVCTQITYERVSRALLERAQPDFTAAFLIANDAVSHTFWHFYEPERFEGVSATDARRLGSVVENMYRHNDRFLGGALDLLDEDTVILVVSDHGFQAGHELPGRARPRQISRSFSEEFQGNQGAVDEVTVGQSGIHALDGLLVASGGPIVQGASFVTPPTIQDLAPTVLALMGFPIAADMPGRVLTEALSDEFLERYPIRTIPSYEDLLDRDLLRSTSETPAADKDDLRMLKALGYLE